MAALRRRRSDTSAERGIELAEPLVAFRVDAGPLGVRIDTVSDTDAAFDGLARVVEAGEERGAEGRSLLSRRALERQAEHRRDDPPPQLAARAAAGDAADRRCHAELAQQLERVAQPVRDPLQHRPHERAAIMP